ncbi:hypothetical protein SOP85_30585 [Pseudomonas sp. YuFO20]|uniref:hypothetical protein n=1 Tax=Pseudomonas sp. YuFO20 TaxID=3095362 RepID=UPI002B2461CE|nr:hypothetical protein [Pseudomonas sp. YuFO20]MEB2519732.1 hypothetical protein [Pseudomonas sp. YuFO20]
MKASIFLVLLMCAASLVEAKEHDYKRVIMAGAGDVGELFIRFLLLSGESCLIIQNLVPGGGGSVSGEKAICSIDGKKIADDFAAVDFKVGDFRAGKLFFEIGVTPLQPIGEVVMFCEVIFSGGLADHLSCTEKDLVRKESCAVLER